MKVYVLCFCVFLQTAVAGNFLEEHLQTFNWDGIEVAWIEDNSVPTYDIIVYFNEGALSDTHKYGLTNYMFNLLTTGTTTRDQNTILEFLEFYGASYGANTTHEFSTYQVSGLTKDMVPTMKLICELFSDAKYPYRELVQHKKRNRHALKNLVANPSALASRAFRTLSLSHTPFANPVDGSLKSIDRIYSKDLVRHRKYFNNFVQKKIYIRGSKKVLALKNVIKNDCKWKKVGSVIKKQRGGFGKNKYEGKIVFVPVAKSNQAQVRIGRVLTRKEALMDDALADFASHMMGSGFTSKLMQRLRVEKGLTYSVSSYVGAQKNYGRVGINTFTKNETIVDLLKSIEDVIKENSSKLKQKEVDLYKRNITGNYLFSLESTSGFLKKLIYLDHIEQDYDKIYTFSPRIEEVEARDLEKEIHRLFNLKKQVITILGDKKLIKKLKNAGYQVITKKYQEFL